jgi:cysteine desulfurase
MKRVYLDHNATTPLDQRVLEAMQPYLGEYFGNASSLHYYGRRAQQALEASRAQAAKLIGAQPDEIIFTSGGTESDNMALRGIAYYKGSGHIITSSVEHHAVLRTCGILAGNDFSVTYLPVDRQGLVDPDEVKRSIRRDTILISVMLANNETGVIEPIPEIGLIARERGIPFHCDAVQAMGKMPVDVGALHVDLLSLSAHKIYGPKGVGALFVKNGTNLSPLITGGHHERGLRAGTENVPAIVGFARALEIAADELDFYRVQVLHLRNKLESNLLTGIEGVTLHSARADRLPHTSCMGFASVEAESILLHLDLKGIAASSGSACTTGEPEPSHVLTAMDVPPEIAQGTIRFSLGRENTEEEIAYTGEVLKAAVSQLRAISFPWQEAGKRIAITGGMNF